MRFPVVMRGDVVNVSQVRGADSVFDSSDVRDESAPARDDRADHCAHGVV
jgi:hypothetical protein